VTLLATTPDCSADEQLCRAVLKVTGNSWLAAAADWLIAKPLVVISIVALGFVVRWLAVRFIRRLTSRAAEGVFPATVLRGKEGLVEDLVLAGERRRQRARTMASVLTSMVSVAVFSLVAVMVLGELGYDIGPLVASAGLVGVALGFGAQSLVKDFLSGIFLFFEDQYGVGDEVVIGDTTGVVEALSLRVTRLRAEDETIWYVRNGEILKVGNKSQRVDPAVPVVGTRVAENEGNEGLAPQAGTRSDPRP
jgi:small conductance mechanosensitive channel